MIFIPSSSKSFSFFQELASIPHGSGNTRGISDYCRLFAESRGLPVIQDHKNNIVIYKSASPGYESHQTVILQGHLDMVCEKDPESEFDFTRDGLQLELEGDWLKAGGTTLGGDDGIAVAMILAILDDNSLPHPALEALFTSDEETGMGGAEALDGSLLKGRLMINLDSEEEGIFTVGCAGGAGVNITLPLVTEPVSGHCRLLTVTGLKGGHSGMEIDKGRINANHLMGEFLSGLSFPFRIAGWTGGSKDNVIPGESSLLIWTEGNLEEAVNRFATLHTPETDPELTMVLSSPEKYPSEAYNKASSLRAAQLIASLPCGVTAMSKNIPGLVETSLNLGILTSDRQALHASFSVRSSVNREKLALINRLCHMAAFFGGDAVTYGHYPAWEFKRESVLRPLMEHIYSEIFGHNPVTLTIHAGLECGLFSEKLPGLDAVSIGPDMQDIHTSRERLSVSSVERTERFVRAVLKAL